MPLCYARGQWLRLSRTEMVDLDVDPDEGRDDGAERDGWGACPACGHRICVCDERDGSEEEDDA